MGVSNKDSHHPHSDPKILYETAENHFLHVSDSRLLKDQRITLGIYPGIEFESESDSEALHFSVRVYLVGNTVYQMSVSTPIGEPCAEATRFLDSFQLIPRLSN
jgi:hypothetical protein